MNYSMDELQLLWEESCERQRELVKRYKETHVLPSRGVIDTPEIRKEEAIRKQIFAEMVKIKKQE